MPLIDTEMEVSNTPNGAVDAAGSEASTTDPAPTQEQEQEHEQEHEQEQEQEQEMEATQPLSLTEEEGLDLKDQSMQRSPKSSSKRAQSSSSPFKGRAHHAFQYDTQEEEDEEENAETRTEDTRDTRDTAADTQDTQTQDGNEDTEDDEEQRDGQKSKKKHRIKPNRSRAWKSRVKSKPVRASEDEGTDTESMTNEPQQPTTENAEDLTQNQPNETETEDVVSQTSEDEELNEKTEELRQEALTSIATIEAEFAKFRERRYDEQTKQLQKDIESFESGTYPPFEDGAAAIRAKREDRIRHAELKLRHAKALAERLFQGNLYAFECDMQVRKGEMRRAMCDELSAKRRKMILEKKALDSSIGNYTPSLERTTMSRRHQQHLSQVQDLLTVYQDGYFPRARFPQSDPDEIQSDLIAMGLRGTKRPRSRGTSLVNGVVNGSTQTIQPIQNGEIPSLPQKPRIE